MSAAISQSHGGPFLNQFTPPSAQELSEGHTAQLKSHSALESICKQIAGLKPSDLAAEVEKLADQFVASSQYKVEPVVESDAADMFDNYFAGSGAFQSVKNRKDIPDSFIYSSAKRIAGGLKGKILHCVVNDNNLRSALSKVDNIATYESLKQFIESDVANPLYRKVEVSKPWDESQASLIDFLTANEGPFIEQIRTHVEEDFPGSEISGDIPSDNGEANVSSVQEISDVTIEWENRHDAGTGWLWVPFSVECELELDFAVYRSESLHVDDWVHVEFGDWENHYFDASGCRQATVKGELLLQWTDEQVKTKDWPKPETEIEISETELHDTVPDSWEPEFDESEYYDHGHESDDDEVEVMEDEEEEAADEGEK